MITVLTATYNRGNDLQNLYYSLCKQTDQSFEWLIIDDGSQDNTEELVNIMISSRKIPIRYFKKSNGGKHTAINAGMKLVTNELVFIVDSDDILTNDAIETIMNYNSKYGIMKEKYKLCGFSFLRAYEDGRINGKYYDNDDFVGNHISIRINGKDAKSDKAEVFYTDCLKKYPFPEIENEKFLGEDVVWMRMAREYNMVFVNKTIYIAEYLEDGLTKNRRKNNIQSPKGCVLRAKEYISKDVILLLREKNILQYLIYGWFAEMRTIDLINGTNEKLLTVLSLLPAWVIYQKWCLEYKENSKYVK